MTKADDIIRQSMGRRSKDPQLEKVTVRLSSDLIELYRERYGRMWQGKVNEVLRSYAEGDDPRRAYANEQTGGLSD